MLRIWESPLKSNTHWEFTLPDGHIIVSSCTRSKGKYPLWDKELFTKKYWELEVWTFESKTMWVYLFKGYINRASTWGQGVDKLSIIDSETWAYYVTEMKGIVELLSGIWENKFKVTKNRDVTYIEWEVTFEYRGGTVFIEFITDKKIEEFNETMRKEREFAETKFISAAKLKPFHRYKKKSVRDEWMFFYVIPFTRTHFDLQSKKLKYPEDTFNDVLKNNYFLVRASGNLEDPSYKGYCYDANTSNWQYYDETPVNVTEIRKNLVLDNQKTLTSRQSYDTSAYVWFEVDENKNVKLVKE